MLGLVLGLLVLGFVPAPERIQPQQAYACGCTGCVGFDPPLARSMLEIEHVIRRGMIMSYLANEFTQHRDWLVNTFFKQEVLPAMQLFTEQMSVVAMQQAFIVGTFFDAKHQLETQRLFQELEVQAHKDYQPSESFCAFGTNVRSLAASEQRGNFSKLALNAQQMARHLGTANAAGTGKESGDLLSRWEAFTTKYCDPQDNNWFATEPNSGLVQACGAGGGNTGRVNIDIDYTRLVDSPRTLDISFSEETSEPSAHEQDILALGKNLYGHKPLARSASGKALSDSGAQKLYFALRSVAAKRSVAQNSFNAIVGMKAEGSSDQSGNAVQTRAFLGAVMQELGVSEDEVFEIIGENPSYYAQLEILAKKIYQSPDFFANLYDKPANIQRKSVALKAIELMLDRAIYESQVRQEMATSVLLSSRLRPAFREANRNLSNVKGE